MHRSPRIVLNPEQLECLRSTLRREMLSAILLQGPCSVAELAPVLGKPAKSLYYQVRQMLACSLIVEAGERGMGRSAETLVDAVADRYELPEDPAAQRAAARNVAATLRQAAREHERAAGEGAMVVRTTARLSTEHRVEFQKRLQAALDYARQHDEEGQERLAIMALATPIKSR